MKRLLVTAALLVLPTCVASAATVEDRMQDFANTEVRGWLDDPVIVAAIQHANLEHSMLSATDIQALDAKWRSEVGTGGEIISAVTDNAASAYLRERIASTGGSITELFVMDARGLNVAASDVTSDYWQGDEDKHQKTFALGPSAIHLSEIELDESTQTYQMQVSFTVTDPSSGAPIGAVTVGLNAESF